MASTRTQFNFQLTPDQNGSYSFDSLITRLQRAFRTLVYLFVDKHLIVGFERQAVGNAFTVTPNWPIIYLTADNPVTSDVSYAIANGTNGQLVILLNVGNNNVLLKQGANIQLKSGVDTFLNTNSGMMFAWNGQDWVEV